MTSILSYEPEYVKNYELGWKSTLQDGRMIFNGAIFQSEYDDKQESILIPVDLTNVATVVRNAASMEMTGLELELNVSSYCSLGPYGDIWLS